MKTVINDITERLKITCMLVSHDPADLLSWADEIVVLRNGELFTKKQIQKRSTCSQGDEYTAALFGICNIIDEKCAYLISGTHVAFNKKSGNVLFARPEQFKIVAEKGSAIKGFVKAITFYGSYCDIDVAIGDLVIIVRTFNRRLQKMMSFI